MGKSFVCDISSLVRYQADQLDRFRKNLRQATAKEDVDAVHDLRVASRRLTDALDMMASWVGRKEAGRSERALKRIRKAFRDVRDLDVLRLSLAETSGREVLGDEAASQIESILACRRARAIVRSRDVSGRGKLTSEVDAIGRMNEAFLQAATRKPKKLEKQLRQMLRKRVSTLLRHDPRAASSDLHAARISVKRARYCAQLLDTCRCLRDGDVINKLVEMQNTLGHWNDHIMAMRMLSRLASRRQVLAEQTAFSSKVLQYAAYRGQSADLDRQKALDLWPGLETAVQTALSDRTDSAVSEEDTETPGEIRSAGDEDQHEQQA